MGPTVLLSWWFSFGYNKEGYGCKTVSSGRNFSTFKRYVLPPLSSCLAYSATLTLEKEVFSETSMQLYQIIRSLGISHISPGEPQMFE
jgi:hypothetical protein